MYGNGGSVLGQRCRPDGSFCRGRRSGAWRAAVCV